MCILTALWEMVDGTLLVMMVLAAGYSFHLKAIGLPLQCGEPRGEQPGTELVLLILHHRETQPTGAVLDVGLGRGQSRHGMHLGLLCDDCGRWRWRGQTILAVVRCGRHLLMMELTDRRRRRRWWRRHRVGRRTGLRGFRSRIRGRAVRGRCG